MLENIPLYIPIAFGLTTAGAFIQFMRVVRSGQFLRGSSSPNWIAFIVLAWLAIQAILSISGTYSYNTGSLPPKILLYGILPPFLTNAALFALKKGRRYLDSLSLSRITYLNTIRIPVEIVLFWLYLNRYVPELMTFEGRNFDIFAGISAPFIAYFGLVKGAISRNTMLIWNLICLGLLVNIVFIALLSAPSPMQKFAYDQPNIGLLNFPFSWLPTFIVPVVLFGHLVSMRRLLRM